jgi:UDP-N-acetylglucosamine 2-epimerase
MPLGRTRLCLTGPLGYVELIAALRAAWVVLTDSGGIQEEAATLRVPLLVLRQTTERPEVISAGIGRMVGTKFVAIVTELHRLRVDAERHAAMRRAESARLFGDGQASQRIVERLLGTPPESGLRRSVTRREPVRVTADLHRS